LEGHATICVFVCVELLNLSSLLTAVFLNERPTEWPFYLKTAKWRKRTHTSPHAGTGGLNNLYIIIRIFVGCAALVSRACFVEPNRGHHRVDRLVHQGTFAAYTGAFMCLLLLIRYILNSNGCWQSRTTPLRVWSLLQHLPSARVSEGPGQAPDSLLNRHNHQT
jgi:hypothetical protein